MNGSGARGMNGSGARGMNGAGAQGMGGLLLVYNSLCTSTCKPTLPVRCTFNLQLQGGALGRHGLKVCSDDVQRFPDLAEALLASSHQPLQPCDFGCVRFFQR